MNLHLTVAAILLLSGCATTSPSDSAKGMGSTSGNNSQASPSAKPESPKTPAVPVASIPGNPNAASASRTAPTAIPTPAGGAPGAPRPFNDVIKDAKEDKGYFTTWHKDDKVWIEIPETMWNQPFFFSVNVTHAHGDSGIFGNQMGAYLAAGWGQQMARFKKFGPNAVQLVAMNTQYRATPNSPAARMLERSFSESLIGQVPIASAPHPERKSILIEANALLVNDYPGGAQQLEQTYRQGYAFDPRNSMIESAKNSPKETGFQVKAHYSLARLAPLPTSPSPPGAPVPRLPQTLPDARSLFLGYYYGFSALPDQPMQTRRSDQRVGYFATTTSELSDPDKRNPTERFINRWRLEKQDPSAAISDPKEPIVFWLDKNIPLKYRDVVKAGVLEWNKAFEQAGFRNAISFKQQENNADFDTSATRIASIRWVTGRGIGFGARGPSKVDPRTGEILDADIEVNENVTRVYSGRAIEDPPRPMTSFLSNDSALRACTYASDKLNEVALGLDLLVGRGEFEYGSPQAEQFVLDALKDLITHEVGHTIGLRHNFRASTAVSTEQLRDSKFGAEVGISSSVMDYNALNIALKNERQGQYSMVTVGPYDRWAVEYGYKQFTPEQEATELAKILLRSTRPELAYGTDEDAGYGSILEGIDPEINRSDLSNDPLAFYEKRFAVVKELWDRWQNKPLPEGTSHEILRRNFDRGFSLIGQVTDLASKYVGGVTVLRDKSGSGRQPVTPVSAATQRRALQLITKNLFEVEAFSFKPEFIGKLVLDFEDRFDSINDNGFAAPPSTHDYSVAGRVFGLQRSALMQILRDTVAARLLGASEKQVNKSNVLPLSEVYGTVQAAIWRELDQGKPINSMRRNLQREYARMLASSVSAPNPRLPADAKSLQRENARDLLKKLQAASAKMNYRTHIETRAHLNDSVALLQAALNAQVSKSLN